MRYTLTAFPQSPVISDKKARRFVQKPSSQQVRRRSQVKKSTQFAKAGEVERKWVLIDAEGATPVGAFLLQMSYGKIPFVTGEIRFAGV